MSRLQPRPKALPTSNLSSQSAAASKEPLSRPETPLSRQAARLISADPLSERATLFLIRRTLGDKGRSSNAPIDEILPPLTSSNEVDIQLYAFISIIIREFVQTWYSKITPDQIFVEEVVKIIAHCTRALEQRLRVVDLENLLFDELPDLLDVHVKAYRAAHNPLHPEPLETDPRQIYHSLWPLPALSPVPAVGNENAVQEQRGNEAAYRQLLVQGVLAVLLPTEDLENDCLTTLTGQILSEMILGGGIGGKACEPWLLWEAITKIAEVIQAQLPKAKAQVRVDRSNSDLVPPNLLGLKGIRKRSSRIGKSMEKMFWLTLQYFFVAFTAVRFAIITIATSSSLPSRIAPAMKMTGSADSGEQMQQAELTNTKSSAEERRRQRKQPILAMKFWSCASNLLDLDARMPWLGATISIIQWGAIAGPGQVGNTDGMIDRILSHAIQTHVLKAALIPPLLRSARAALFPNNTLPPARAIPSPSEQLLIRTRCAKSILALVPTRIRDVYFGGPDVVRSVEEVEEVLNVFADPYCNKHLLYGVVELIVVRLVPELAEVGIEEILAERLS